MTSSRVLVRPTVAVQVANYGPAETFGPRRLIDHEFVWLLAGSALWSSGPGWVEEDQTALRLTRDTLVLARAGTVDSYQWDDRVASAHVYVHFRLVEAGQLPPEGEWPSSRSLPANPVLDGLCHYLLELAGDPSPAARSRSDELVGLLLDLFVRGPLPEPVDTLTAHVAEVVDHVRRTWDTEGVRILEAEELAEATNISAGHVFRLFRQDYGCGPARAFELVRLARAATALRRSNASLTQIARQSGFANPYHFSRRFRQAYGTPPGAYRSAANALDPLQPVRDAGLLAIAHRLRPRTDSG